MLRGPLIGSTFQGTLYDKNGNMDMTGTFMPAYGLNRIFGEIPLIGVLLGNGRDRGLIGVTFKLDGDADQPQLQINPLSVIAPGIFRSIFEFQVSDSRRCSAGRGAARMRHARTATLIAQVSGPDQNVLLLAERQLDHAVGREIGGRDDAPVVADRLVVDAHRAALDVTARLAVRGRKPGRDEQRQDADAGLELCPADLDRRQRIGGRAFLEGLARGFGCLLGGLRGHAASR